MTPLDVQSRLDSALEISAHAERLVLKYFQNRSLNVEFKGDQSPVTVADRGAEELLRAHLHREYPDDAILGEEFGEQPGSNGFKWILDPIDGTKAFVAGVPLFGMLIGLMHGDEYVAGICRLPATQEIVFAQRGKGAWWQKGDADPVQTRVREVAELSDATFCFTDIECWQQTDHFDAFSRMSERCRLARGWGDCYGHIMIATRQADVMIDPLLSEWDAAALIPIIEEAGGTFMDWTGTATAKGGNGISTTPALKSQVLEVLNGQR